MSNFSKESIEMADWKIKSIQEVNSRKEERLSVKACLEEEWKPRKKKVDSVI